MNQVFFKYNRAEFWLFRLVKPIGWILFTFGLISLIICLTFFVINLLKVKELTVIDFSSHQDLVGAGIVKFVDENNGYNIFRKIYSFGYATIISILFCVITRINTKFWVILRFFNQYSSVVFSWYHNKKKLFSSLFFNLISLIASIIFCYAIWNTLFILFDYIKTINNDYNNLCNQLFLLTNVDESAIFIQNFLQNAKILINKFIQNFSIKQHLIYSITAIVSFTIWICSNLFYGLYLFIYIPRYYAYEEKKWSYLSMVDDNILKDKKLPVARQMDYSRFNSKMSNGYSGKEQNLRDKQYDIYARRRDPI